MAQSEILVELRLEVPVADLGSPVTTEDMDRKIEEIRERAEWRLGARVREATFVVRHPSFLSDARYDAIDLPTSASSSSSASRTERSGETVSAPVGAGGSPTAPFDA